jgi:NAD(P)-dependent dehydrogenase (short-subunit alcohol dehydrogenase family)
VVDLVRPGPDGIGVPTDVADAGALARLRDAAFERFDTVHVLCNNAPPTPTRSAPCGR